PGFVRPEGGGVAIHKVPPGPRYLGSEDARPRHGGRVPPAPRLLCGARSGEGGGDMADKIRGGNQEGACAQEEEEAGKDGRQEGARGARRGGACRGRVYC